MKQYLQLMQHILTTGTEQENRTGVNAISVPGAMMQFDLYQGFPAVTTKKLAFDSMKGELLAFIEGATSAARFRELGCNFWDQNANENKAWLANPNRKGVDDLGLIYGAMWRQWPGQTFSIPEFEEAPAGGVFRGFINGNYVYSKDIDQLQNVIDTIRNDPTNRRIRMTAWRPDMFDKMALPPCHCEYQFIVNTKMNELNLCMTQRSCDMFLGVPMNIASAALLLEIVAKLTGYRARHFTHFLADAHIYVNHVEQVKEQLLRTPKRLPNLWLSPHLTDINSITPDMIGLEEYNHHPAIKAPMAV